MVVSVSPGLDSKIRSCSSSPRDSHNELRVPSSCPKTGRTCDDMRSAASDESEARREIKRTRDKIWGNLGEPLNMVRLNLRKFLGTFLDQCMAGAFLAFALVVSAQEMKALRDIQFIAAAIDPTGPGNRATSGKDAHLWGIWRIDPGPRGVRLQRFNKDLGSGRAPAGWSFDSHSWWLEEHGLIMEAPEFPLPPMKYQVTGGRETTSILSVSADGSWELSGGATLYDVTHLPCRSALYTGGSPANANPNAFPVKPGGPMPAVEGCLKQDYSVLFVTALEH